LLDLRIRLLVSFRQFEHNIGDGLHGASMVPWLRYAGERLVAVGLPPLPHVAPRASPDVNSPGLQTASSTLKFGGTGA